MSLWNFWDVLSKESLIWDTELGFMSEYPPKLLIEIEYTLSSSVRIERFMKSHKTSMSANAPCFKAYQSVD